MLLPPSAFTHVPELSGKIKAPETSYFRMSHATIDSWDGFARQMGLADSWRHTHDERETLRRESLSGRLDKDLWVFAYGAIMWDPGFHAVEIRRARLEGWHRRFCALVEFGRGTPEQPCLQGGLDVGGCCDGLAFRIPAEAVDRETEILCMRELICSGYKVRFLSAHTPQGSIEAMAFTSDRNCHRYSDLPEEETVRIITTAKGFGGTNREYLDNIVTKLRELEISDPATERLAKLCAEYASASSS